MQLEMEQLEIILTILKASLPQAKIIVFGSRLKNEAKKYSDLDLAINNGAPIALAILGKLEDQLSDSDIPFKIELIDFHRVSKEFQEHILHEGKYLN